VATVLPSSHRVNIGFILNVVIVVNDIGNCRPLLARPDRSTRFLLKRANESRVVGIPTRKNELVFTVSNGPSDICARQCSLKMGVGSKCRPYSDICVLGCRGTNKMREFLFRGQADLHRTKKKLDCQ
jgi:hypothetical protein